ncbi:MAG: DNA pilot protein [Microviridae sp.]|nr:MAG: DNA pilot protein [Microviridae sp.]
MADIPWLGIATTGADIIGNQINSKVQYERTKKLMDVQQLHQQELNKQGQQIQLDTWEKTNYPAQVEMLKSAGLNPALLYSKGGQGGTTGGQGGGSASGGTVQNAPPMNITNIMEIQNMKAQRDLIEAQTAKTKTETELLPKTAGAEVTSKEAGATKAGAETENIKVETEIKKIEQANTQRQIDTGIENTAQVTKNLMQQNLLTQAQFDSIVNKTAEEATGAYLENELTKSKTKLTETEMQSIKTSIVQKWTELSQKATGLDQEQQKIELNKFVAEMNSKYPSIMNTAGGLIQGALNQLEAIGRYFNPKVFDYSRKAPK